MINTVNRLMVLCICLILFAVISVSEWEGEVLELTRISRLDMGAYLCIASNGVPPTVSKRIRVSVDCKYLCYCDYILPLASRWSTVLFTIVFFYLVYFCSVYQCVSFIVCCIAYHQLREYTSTYMNVYCCLVR